MQTYITLNDGTKIPQFGLGVYMLIQLMLIRMKEVSAELSGRVVF